MRARWALVSLVAAACAFDDLDYTGKSCPCPIAWTCVNDACQRGPGGGPSPPVPGPGDGAYKVSELRAAWATPNTIRWEWKVDGDPQQFGRFELAVTGAGVTKTWTADDLPELGRATLQTRGASDLIRVTATQTDGLAPDTQYTGTLTAYDTAGRAIVSNSAGLSTPLQLSQRIVLFSEARPGGYPLPTVLTIGSGCGANGTNQCIRYTSANDAERVCDNFGCGQNLRWQDLGVSTSALGSEVFARAYLELFLRSTPAPTSYYSLLWLYVEPPAEGCNPIERCLFEHTAWTYKPSDTYRRIQIPLGFLKNEFEERLSYPVLSRGAFGFNVHAQWGETVELDEIAIFY